MSHRLGGSNTITNSICHLVFQKHLSNRAPCIAESPSHLVFQKHPAYLTLWSILTVKEFCNAAILCFSLHLSLFSGLLGCIFGFYFVVVVISLVGVTINLIGTSKMS